jgi:hypothetical protein
MRSFRNTPILAVLILVVSVTSLPALEIDEGRVRLDVSLCMPDQGLLRAPKSPYS